MATLNQLIKKARKPRRKKRRVALDKCPQKKGICIRVFRMNPKKPNSANRWVASVLFSNKRKKLCSIPGIGHSLKMYSTVLIRGGRVRDLPGVNYKLIRGKFDLGPMLYRRSSRSKYGVVKLHK